MSGNDLQNELEQLRADVAALTAARESKQAEEVQQKTSPLEEPPPSMDEVDDIIKNAKAAVTADTELNGQFDQLFEHLEHEIKDLPAITTMAVFSLGVLFGRLLR